MIRSRERRARLLEALAAGEADVDDLARRFDVSPSTVRRDLQRLSRENAVTRTYGGAILASAQRETTLGERLSVNGDEKRAIARAAAALVGPGEALILDAGSTVAAFASLIAGPRRIVTNNLAILPLFAEAVGVELTVLGGALRATSMSTVGPIAIEAMRKITADKVFMSADGVMAGRGLCEASLDQTALKSMMMEQAGEIVVLADATKLGRAEQSAWAPLPRRWTLVTDARATAEQRHALAAVGATVIMAAET